MENVKRRNAGCRLSSQTLTIILSKKTQRPLTLNYLHPRFIWQNRPIPSCRLVYLLAARNGIHETNAMFVLVCLEVNKFTKSYEEYKIFVTTKVPKNGQKQRSHSSRAVANPRHHSLVVVMCASRKAQHNAICCPRLILTFHN